MEAYLEPSSTMMELFCKNGQQLLPSRQLHVQN